ISTGTSVWWTATSRTSATSWGGPILRRSGGWAIVLRKRIAESLTARIFLITAGVLLIAGAVTFGFIAWATPSTYTAVVNGGLTAQVDALVEQLAVAAPE